MKMKDLTVLTAYDLIPIHKFLNSIFMTRMKLVVYITAFLGTVLYAYNYLNPPQTWEVENKKAITAFHKSQFDEAEKHFVQALKLAETFSVKDPRLYFSLGQLAEFYRIQSMFLKAEKVLHHTLVIDDKVFGPKHYNKALNLNNLAVNYRIQGKFEDAKEILEQSLKILEDSLGKEHLLARRIFDHYTHLLNVMNSSKEDQKAYK